MIASGLIKIFADAGMQVTSISTSLLAVLMFGAGTDYCLLLVARYIEELHTHEDKHEALQRGDPARRAGDHRQRRHRDPRHARADLRRARLDAGRSARSTRSAS